MNSPSVTSRADTSFRRHRPSAPPRWLSVAIVGFFAWYGIYILMLGKLFSPSVAPQWYRDLGILWDLADYTVRSGHYLVGQYFFPPSNAILAHVYGLMDRDIAFRLYLVAGLAAVAVTIWGWSRFIGIAADPSLAPIILVAFLASHFYVAFELSMHNTNAVTLALVSLALTFQRRPIFSSGCYAFALAIKPYSSVLIVPWMAWRGNWRWVAGALGWLVLWFGVVPAIWFGVSTNVELYREWLASMFAIAANNGDPNQLSIRAGLAALTHWDIADPRAAQLAIVLQAAWIVALAAFFLPTLMRRQAGSGVAAACEVAAILMIGLPLGDHQQPARAIVLLTATLLIAAAVFDDRNSRRRRVVLGAVLTAIGISTHVVPMGPLHFLLTLPVCLLALAGLAIARATPSAAKAAP